MMKIKRYVRCMEYSIAELNTLMIALNHEYVSANPGNYHLLIGARMGDDGRVLLDIKRDDVLVETVGVVAFHRYFALGLKDMPTVNKKAEQMFKEDSQYGIKDEGTLSAIIASSTGEFYNQPNYPGIVQKAAAYWYKIATSQVFHNGNKRSALLSGLYMLYVNGYEWIGLDGNELYDLSLKIAKKDVTFEELNSIILAHLGVRFFKNIDEAKKHMDFNIKMKLEIDNPNV